MKPTEDRNTSDYVCEDCAAIVADDKGGCLKLFEEILSIEVAVLISAYPLRPRENINEYIENCSKSFNLLSEEFGQYPYDDFPLAEVHGWWCLGEVISLKVHGLCREGK